MRIQQHKRSLPSLCSPDTLSSAFPRYLRGYAFVLRRRNNFKVNIVFLRELPFGDADQFHGKARSWTFLAIAQSDGCCQVEDFLSGLQGPLQDTGTEMLAFLEGMVFDEQGPLRWLGTKRSHESVANHRIFEF